MEPLVATNPELGSQWITLLKNANVFCCGLEAGALLFVSAVSALTLRHFANTKKDQVLREFFPVWWPLGRNLMAPLGILICLINLFLVLQTGEIRWLFPLGLIAFIIGWTIIAMGEDIDALRKGSSKDVFSVTASFCKRHHLRTVLSFVAFFVTLIWIQ
jgi:tetrahydromethanopterin S-methyltransferase subunit E